MVYPGFPPIVSLLQKQKHQPCLLCATLIIKSLKTPPRPGETGSTTASPRWRMVTILVEMLLDPLRRVWGSPIVISSGYRCPELNILIGGAKHSHHLLGCAADLIAGSPDDHRRLFRLIQETHELCGLEFTQLILEPGARWIHISYVPGNLRCQVIDKEKSPN